MAAHLRGLRRNGDDTPLVRRYWVQVFPLPIKGRRLAVLLILNFQHVKRPGGKKSYSRSDPLYYITRGIFSQDLHTGLRLFAVGN